MIIFPTIDPVIFHLGPLAVHWYGLMYLIGFASAWVLALSRRHQAVPVWSKDDVGDLIFYGAIGVVVGGRLGYMLVYNWSAVVADPLAIFKIWQGGMSFHGGLIGVLLAMWMFACRHQRSFFSVTDFIAPLVPVGLAAGRLGNFINGELWGRVTEMPWGIVYPQAGWMPRHPSELYEFLLEGVVLFFILWIYSRKPRPRMSGSGLFLLCYGCFRFLVEFYREPDPQLGFIAFDWLTMGQLLSLPMIFLGIILLCFAHCRKSVLNAHDA